MTETPATGDDNLVDGAPISRIVATRIRAYRDHAGLSQGQLAARMRGYGWPMTRQILSSIERGERAAVTVDDLMALIAATGLSPEFWLTERHAMQCGDIDPCEACLMPDTQTAVARARQLPAEI